jgi:hypothetical protein
LIAGIALAIVSLGVVLHGGWSALEDTGDHRP